MDKQKKLPSRIFQHTKYLLQSGPAREPWSGGAGGLQEPGSHAVGTVPSAASARRSSLAFLPHLCQTAVLPEVPEGDRGQVHSTRAPHGGKELRATLASSARWAPSPHSRGGVRPVRGTLPHIREVLEKWQFPLPPRLNCP